MLLLKELKELEGVIVRSADLGFKSSKVAYWLLTPSNSL